MKKKHTKHSRKTTARSKITSTACSSPNVNTAPTNDAQNSSEIGEQKLTKKQLHDLLADCRLQLNMNRAELRQVRANFEQDRKKWMDGIDRVKLDAKVTVARASSAMIEALARMIGGDGF